MLDAKGLPKRVPAPDQRTLASIQFKRHRSVAELARQVEEVGRPVDLGEWGMTPPSVNACFDPPVNDIKFPAGVLQPPLCEYQVVDGLKVNGALTLGEAAHA